MYKKLNELEARRHRAEVGGGDKKIRSQHDKGDRKSVV